VSVEQSAVFDVTPITATLKETVQKQQQLVWRVAHKSGRRRKRNDASRFAAR
jgi:hypothetical protein